MCWKYPVISRYIFIVICSHHNFSDGRMASITTRPSLRHLPVYSPWLFRLLCFTCWYSRVSYSECFWYESCPPKSELLEGGENNKTVSSDTHTLMLLGRKGLIFEVYLSWLKPSADWFVCVLVRYRLVHSLLGACLLEINDSLEW